jgi:uncharacterized protein
VTAQVPAPRGDAEVPGFCRALGIPGLIDIHTHFMPERVLAAVWRYFDAVSTPDGVGWPITYREDEPRRLAQLRAMNVRAFTALSYPHKPDMAGWLNAYSARLAAEHSDCVHSATFYPEPGVADDVAAALDSGARVFKAHLQVGAYDPRDPLLVPVWEQLSAAGVPVVVHAGSGPEPGPFTGPEPFGEVLARHPNLTAVIAHMGGGEYAEFLEMALRYPNVHLDTTMTFTDYMSVMTEYPRELLPVLAQHPERIVLGTDFPNIPHPYAHQLEALVRLDLGDAWLRAVCHDNGARLLGIGDSDLA